MHHPTWQKIASVKTWFPNWAGAGNACITHSKYRILSCKCMLTFLPCPLPFSSWTLSFPGIQRGCTIYAGVFDWTPCLIQFQIITMRLRDANLSAKDFAVEKLERSNKSQGVRMQIMSIYKVKKHRLQAWWQTRPSSEIGRRNDQILYRYRPVLSASWKSGEQSQIQCHSTNPAAWWVAP